VAERPTGYGGQGFSLRGEKDRFVLPPKLRNPLAEQSGERTLCIGPHVNWPCMIGFGVDRKLRFDSILDREEAKATSLGHVFDRDEMMMQLWDFEEVPFDASGRFVMPGSVSEVGDIGDAIYFQGMGDYFAIWVPDILFAQEGKAFASPKAKCRAEMAAAEAKRK